MKERNHLIDVLRGITALNIIVIHTVWWSGQGYVPDWVRNLVLLLDVPMFFFLAGWSASYAKAIHVFRGLLENQKKWLFFMFFYGLIVEFFYTPGYSMMQWIRIFFFEFPNYSSWVYPVLFGSLWFMPIFIGVSLIAIPFRLIFENLDELNRKRMGLSVVWIFALAFAYVALGNSILNLSIAVLFYAIFYTLGYYTKDITIKNSKILLLYLILIVFAEIILYRFFSVDVFELQTWKFGPSVPYLIPSMISIVLVLFIKSKWYPKEHRLITWVGKNAIFLYFAQGISSSILYEFLLYIPLIYWPVRFLIALVFNVILALGIAYGVASLYQYSTVVIQRFSNKFYLD